MAYKKEDMIKQCLEAIEENSLVFIEEIIAFVPFSKPTFYKHKLNEVNDIERAIENNKIQIKQKLRNKWLESKAPALQISLYRLLASEKEYECLIMQKFDHTSGGDKIQPLNITVDSQETKDELTKLINGKSDTNIPEE